MIRVTPFIIACFGVALPALLAKSDAPSPAFQQGHVERMSYENWIATLSGDTLDGAKFWAAHRSDHAPPSCANPLFTEAFTNGCKIAKVRLAPSDIGRKTDPEFKAGWNSPLDSLEAAAPAQPTSSPPPAPVTVSSSAVQSEPGLYWKLKHTYNPMDHTTTDSATASFEPDGGGTLTVEAVCTDGVLSLTFASFDGRDNPLDFDIHGSDDPYVPTRVQYNNESPKAFSIHLKRHTNSITATVSGSALLSFAGANTIMYEIPLSDGRRVFPVFQPQDNVLTAVMQPCMGPAREEVRKQARDKVEEDERIHQYDLESQRHEAYCRPFKQCLDQAGSNTSVRFYCIKQWPDC
jgi:hypothetical protein